MSNPPKKPDPYAVETKPDKPRESGGKSHFSARIENGVHVLTFEQANVLDAYEIEQLGDAIYDHIKPLDAPRLVISLENVQHLSSAALGMLVALRKVAVDQKGGDVALAHVSEDLRSIFKMTRLDKLIPIHDNTAKAVNSLG